MTHAELEVKVALQERRLTEMMETITRGPSRFPRSVGGGGAIRGLAMVRPSAVSTSRQVSVTFLDPPGETAVVPADTSELAWCGPMGFTAEDFRNFEWTSAGPFPFTLPVDEAYNALPVFDVLGKLVVWWMPPVQELSALIAALPHLDAFLDTGAGFLDFSQ